MSEVFKKLIDNYFLEFTTKTNKFNSNKFISNEDKNEILCSVIDEKYFKIEDNKVIWKKKEYKFIGKVDLISKTELIDIIKNINSDWCKNYYFMPLDENLPLIFISEEGSFFLVNAKNNTSPLPPESFHMF
ncbi:MAG: hypothetical protein QM535_19820 [Limnohabitans sp.]|nr:hypothetical protein [Limnohabitans sp.]